MTKSIGRLTFITMATLAQVITLMASETRAQEDQAVYDIVVYGDSSGAITAAVAAKRQGRSVILVNPTRFLGGMSASGLSATDFLGKRATIGGIASEYYVNEEGCVRRDGTIWRVPPRPYGISYRSITPRTGECENLLVPLCLSASHVAHGSIRMEPVFMVLSQSAATAAGVALDDDVSVQEVGYAALRERLEADKQRL